MTHWYRTAADPFDNQFMAWHGYVFGGKEVEVPLFFVNREARRVAQKGIQGQGVTTRLCEDHGIPLLSCSFHRSQVALYVSQRHMAETGYPGCDRLLLWDIEKRTNTHT